jgi:hypothetical protein
MPRRLDRLREALVDLGLPVLNKNSPSEINQDAIAIPISKDGNSLIIFELRMGPGSPMVTATVISDQGITCKLKPPSKPKIKLTT